MTNIYSLADYTVSFKAGGVEVKIGGTAESSGSVNQKSGYLNRIILRRTNNAWDTASDVTGGFVHNRNLSKIGTVTVQINQISDNIARLLYILKAYENSTTPVPFDIYITQNGNVEVATCKSCLIQKASDQTFGESADYQEWVFTCGEIIFNNTRF